MVLVINMILVYYFLLFIILAPRIVITAVYKYLNEKMKVLILFLIYFL